ncbi:hypothetical protein [Spongiactinospora sp. TRM90649]|uniref:hypothetical protein n=1 Tax=Spongiactinospora sp. TRM90649 TaxID=3031114 RepID=UPI0023F8ACFA|nr:hypothetical protein [Spongiactinospora sp. TRM90649]MDF5754263.1 hypothetical protein [Spongiactinospora sp. TRM90649]
MDQQHTGAPRSPAGRRAGRPPYARDGGWDEDAVQTRPLPRLPLGDGNRPAGVTPPPALPASSLLQPDRSVPPSTPYYGDTSDRRVWVPYTIVGGILALAVAVTVFTVPHRGAEPAQAPAVPQAEALPAISPSPPGPPPVNGRPGRPSDGRPGPPDKAAPKPKPRTDRPGKRGHHRQAHAPKSGRPQSAPVPPPAKTRHKGEAAKAPRTRRSGPTPPAPRTHPRPANEPPAVATRKPPRPATATPATPRAKTRPSGRTAKRPRHRPGPSPSSPPPSWLSPELACTQFRDDEIRYTTCLRVVSSWGNP